MILTTDEVTTSLALYGIVHITWKAIGYLSSYSLKLVKTETDHVIREHVEHRHKQNLKRCRLGLCKYVTQKTVVQPEQSPDRLLV